MTIWLAHRPLFWLALCAVAGILVQSHGDVMWVWPVALFYSAAGLLAGMTIMASLVRWRYGPLESLEDDPRAHGLCMQPGLVQEIGVDNILLLTGAMLAAAMMLRAGQVQTAHEQVEAAAPERFLAVLTIEHPPEPRIDEGNDGWYATATVTEVDGEPVTPFPVRLRGRGQMTVVRGDRLTGWVAVEPLRPPGFLRDFDRRAYLRERGQSLSLRATGPLARKLDVPDNENWGARQWREARGLLDAVRAATIVRLLTARPGVDGRLLAVVLFGYRVPWDDSQGESFRQLRGAFRHIGIGHLLAISGLHVGLIAGLTWLVLSLPLVDRRWRALVTMAVVLLFLGMSGGRVAAVRASVMALTYLGGVALGRRSDLINAMGLAAILLLAVNPVQLQSLGFQLSFLAVLFISRLFHEWDEWRGRIADEADAKGARTWRLWARRYALSMVLLSIFAWLGVWPLAARAFGQVAFIGLLLNVVMIPLMSVVLAGGVLLCALCWISPAAVGLAGSVFASPALGLIALTKAAHGSSVGVVPIHPPELVWLWVYYGGFGIFFLRHLIDTSLARRVATAVSLLVILTGSVGLCGIAGAEVPGTQPETWVLFHPQGAVVIATDGQGSAIVAGRPYRGGQSTRAALEALQVREVSRLFELTGSYRSAGFAAVAEDLPVLDAYAYPLAQPPEAGGSDAALASTMEWPGGTIYLSRDRSGRLVWWSVKTMAGTVLLTDGCWPEQATYRVDRHWRGWDAPLVFLSIRGRERWREVARRLPAQWIVVDREAGNETPGVLGVGRVSCVRLWRDPTGALHAARFSTGNWQAVAPRQDQPAADSSSSP